MTKKLTIYLRGNSFQIQLGKINFNFLEVFKSICLQEELTIESGWFINELYKKAIKEYRKHFTASAIEKPIAIEGLILNKYSIIELRNNNKLSAKYFEADLLNKNTFFQLNQLIQDELDLTTISSNFNFISYVEQTGTFKKLVYEADSIDANELIYELTKIKLPFLTIPSLTTITYNGSELHKFKGDNLVNRQILTFL